MIHAPRSHLQVALTLALLVGSLVSVTATPPRPGTEGNGLTENESAVLWSRDNDSQYITNSEYREAYNDSRTALQQVANGTDLTYKRPPATAATWTRNDFRDLPHTDSNRSVYPSHAAVTDGTYIKDAHATVFAIQPATKTHVTPDEQVWYIAPTGTLRGFVDYRVVVPHRQRSRANVSYAVLGSEIEEVRLQRDGETIARQNGSHTPVFEYDLTGDDVTLTLEAEIEARVRKTVTRRVERNNRTITVHDRTTNTESVTVRDRVQVVVYQPRPLVKYTRYPDGDTGVAIYVSRPWQGYTTPDTGRVRGVWRFYTARDTSWDRLTVATADGNRTRRSEALPVYVHAYPSRIGPRADPTGIGPDLLRVWGEQRQSPAGIIGENVTVEVVERPYRLSYGLAARHDARVERVQVRGIVRGVETTHRLGSGTLERALRRSNLTARVIDHEDGKATVRIRLRDARTGEPIALRQSVGPRYAPIVDEHARTGYITIAGQRVYTDASGTATVTIQEAGVYTVTYHPESWLSYEPAYTRSTAVVRWHPLTTFDGWVTLLVTVLQLAIPFGVALYAGKQLGRLFEARFP